MLKKTSADAKIHIVFSIVFSLIFREKSTNNLAKRVKTIHVHKNRQKITRGTLSFSKKTIFSAFLGSHWVPRGLPGRPGEFPKSLISLIHGQLRLKTTVDGLGKAPELPPGSPTVRFCIDFWIDFARQKQTKKYKKCLTKTRKNIKELERTCTLIRATDEPLYR